MNKSLIFLLFQQTSKYHQPKKESLNELRSCYEHYSYEYISSPNFLKELNKLGFVGDENGEVLLKMRKNVRKTYFCIS
jgi:hypothetical protein